MKDLKQISKFKTGYDVDYNQNIVDANANFTELKNSIEALGTNSGSGSGETVVATPEGHNNVVYYNPTAGPSIIVGFKYGMATVPTAGTTLNQKDFFIEFQKCGVNNLLAMNKFYEAENTTDEVLPNALREKTELKSAGTDFISPVMVKCIDTSVTGKNDDATSAFTGGWHGYNGDQTGNSTAKTSKYELFLDGIKQNYTDIVNKKVDRVDLKVINYIQAYNTKKETGEGTYVLEETVVYTIIKNTVNVSVSLKALKSCLIETYYGLQSSNSGIWNKSISYPRGESKVRLVFADNVISDGETAGRYFGSTSGTHELFPNADRWVVRGDNHHALCCFVDKGFGLGKKSYLGTNVPNIFTQGYGLNTDSTKTYFNFVKSFVNGSYNGLVLSNGKIMSWRGGYIFTNMAGQSSKDGKSGSVDYIDVCNEYGRTKIIFDCYAPCGTFIVDDMFIGKNIKDIVNMARKSKTSSEEEEKYDALVDVTQNVNGLSLLSSNGLGHYVALITDNMV